MESLMSLYKSGEVPHLVRHIVSKYTEFFGVALKPGLWGQNRRFCYVGRFLPAKF
jgi:hypothetical protein